MSNSTEIWQHEPSGEIYLVRVCDDSIIAACGPVTHQEAEYTVDDASGWFNDDMDTTEWVILNADSFRVK